MKIHFFWVGAALNESMDNTNFLIEDWDSRLQVDCTWWLSLAQRVKRKEAVFWDIFITHKHTDHILWFFNLIRTVRYSFVEKLNVYCSKNVEKSIKDIITALEFNSWVQVIKEKRLIFKNIEDKKEEKIGWFNLIPIDLKSNKIEQYWFLLESNWKKILFFWDEAVNILSRDDLDAFKWVDYIICEALLTHEMSVDWWWKIDNNKMFHITAREAWKIATKLEAKNLVLVHTYEVFDWNRQDVLIWDAKIEFDWNIIVPNPLDVLEF